MSFLPGWTLETEGGRRVAIEFLDRYSEELTQVHRIFVAFVADEGGISYSSRSQERFRPVTR